MSIDNPAGGNTEGNMNIRRFVAENSRMALRQVKEQLGGDAIILANRSIAGGVEVLAAAPEAVDALTRRMTEVTASSRLVTPTELGLKRTVEAIPEAQPQPTPASLSRGRLASLFSRRTQSQSQSHSQSKSRVQSGTPTMVEQTTSMIAQSRTAKALSSYADFVDEIAASADDDFAVQLAPDSVSLSRPAPANAKTVAPAAPVFEVPSAGEPVVQMVVPVLEAQRAVPPVPAAASAAPGQVTAPVASLSDAVAREVHREVSREFGREVIDGLARDVTREVSREVSREMHAMQAKLTEQLSTLMWTDAMRRQPARTKLMQDLVLAGFSPALSRHIQERLPADYTNQEAHAWAESILCRNLPVAGDADALIGAGGVFALVGPTGVGKTTTVAKLAARFALTHGVDQLALITTDGFRIGAQDQLRIYGKILGVAVRSIHDEASLTSAIEHMKDKKLVLIDTAGLSQRDERVAEQIAMLRGAKARRLVVLNAAADAETLEHVVATFADREFAGCVITKTDEAARLGPVLDVVIRHRLRIHHVSTGQKVPEDLERPDGAALVRNALARPAERSVFDVEVDDAPIWMSAMVESAKTLERSLDTAVPRPTQPGEAVHV